MLFQHQAMITTARVVLVVGRCTETDALSTLGIAVSTDITATTGVVETYWADYSEHRTTNRPSLYFTFIPYHEQSVALTERSRTGPLCTVGRPIVHAPGCWPAGPPAALQTTTNDRRQPAKQYWPIRRVSNNAYLSFIKG